MLTPGWVGVNFLRLVLKTAVKTVVDTFRNWNILSKIIMHILLTGFHIFLTTQVRGIVQTSRHVIFVNHFLMS